MGNFILPSRQHRKGDAQHGHRRICQSINDQFHLHPRGHLSPPRALNREKFLSDDSRGVQLDEVFRHEFRPQIREPHDITSIKRRDYLYGISAIKDTWHR
ncbi:hypothetical protein HAX54_038610, partial [Datura stramonium]|nr:hypothetical protein [Datura stramonium]